MPPDRLTTSQDRPHSQENLSRINWMGFKKRESKNMMLCGWGGVGVGRIVGRCGKEDRYDQMQCITFLKNLCVCLF